MDRTLIEIARRSAGLSQSELARLSGTAQSTISEYERRRKSPTLQVVERLLDAMDSVLMVIPTVEFDEHEDPELGTFFVADRLWALLPPLCMDRVRRTQACRDRPPRATAPPASHWRGTTQPDPVRARRTHRAADLGLQRGERQHRRVPPPPHRAVEDADRRGAARGPGRYDRG